MAGSVKRGGGSPRKSDLNPTRVAKMAKYRTSNKRYKNKVAKVTKRYKNCPKVLEKVLKTVVEYRKGYKRGRD